MLKKLTIVKFIKMHVMVKRGDFHFLKKVKNFIKLKLDIYVV